MSYTSINICMWAIIIAAYVATSHWDQEDNSGEHKQAAQVEQDMKDKELEKERDALARSICGNAPNEWLDKNRLRCTPRHKEKPYIVYVVGQ